MDQEKYLMVQQKVVAFSNVLLSMASLDEFIVAGERADAIGPIVDPTLWRAGSGNLNKIMGMARALSTCQRELKKL